MAQFAELQRAASKADRDAMFQLSLAYRSGKIVARDDAAAVAFLQEAAELGHLGAKRKLAGLLLEGRLGLDRDRKRALRLWNEVAAAGDLDTKCFLASMYFNSDPARKGTVVARDVDKALRLWQEAANEGHAHAHRTLDAALDELKAEASTIERMYSEALTHAERGDHEKAFSNMLTAARAGYPQAKLDVAEYYRQGLVVRRDIGKAISIWQSFTPANLLSYEDHTLTATAMCRLGECFVREDGVASSLPRAMKLWRQASELDLQVAQDFHRNCGEYTIIVGSDEDSEGED
jgi:TPR repeat protein